MPFVSDEEVVREPKSFRDMEMTVLATTSSLNNTFWQPKTRRSESSVNMASTKPARSRAYRSYEIHDYDEDDKECTLINWNAI